jgi:hypothetical protein
MPPSLTKTRKCQERKPLTSQIGPVQRMAKLQEALWGHPGFVWVTTQVWIHLSYIIAFYITKEKKGKKTKQL